MPSRSDQRDDQVLRRAADILRERGWIGGGKWPIPYGLCAPEYKGPLCMIEAVMVAYGEPHYAWGGIKDRHPPRALVEVCGGYMGPTMSPEIPVWTFNDHPGMTAEDAIAALEIAADLSTPYDGDDDGGDD